MGTIRKDWNGASFIDYVDATGRRCREVVGYSEDAKRTVRKELVRREAELNVRNV